MKPTVLSRALAVVCVAVTAQFLASCSARPDLEAERAEVERVVRGSIQWALRNDVDLLFNTLAHDDEFFIFHPDSASTIHGWQAVEAMANQVFLSGHFRATRTELKDLYVGISAEGDAAWFRTYLDDFGEWDGQPIGWANARWTGVLEKRPEGWRIVQMHFSLPTDRVESE
jgi:hypothetical protein